MDRYKYRVEIQQMMFVSGATSDPPVETVCLMEDIVRAQVVELISRGMALARRRGVRSLAVEDVMFLLRHDVAKVNRLSNYLSWKEVRRNAREQDGAAVEPDILDDPGVVTNQDATRKLYKKQRINLPWRFHSMFPVQLVEEEDAEETDEEDLEALLSMIERLKNADLRTRNMTKEEYVHWSECRQASFTFRKSKRFREWVGISHLTDVRLQDDIIDIFGFLTFEIVANLTELSLKIQQIHHEDNVPAKHKHSSLFDRPNTQQIPLLPEYVRAAYAQYNCPTMHNRAMRSFERGKVRYGIKLI